MTQPLSIGIVCFPSLGGSGVIASEIAVGLARRGHEVHLLASARPARATPHERLHFHEIATPDYPVFEHAPYTLALATTIAGVARAHRLDVLHVHYAVPHAVSAWLARQLLGTSAPRLVTSLHGTDVTRVGADPAYREVTAAAVAASDAVVVPSDFLRREAHARLGLPASCRVDVLPNFVDTEHFSPPGTREPGRLGALFGDREPGPYLVHVSNFREVKRVRDLVDVLARVRRSVPARLVLVGDGPERAHVEAHAAALGLTPHVVFLGRRRDFVEDLRHADVFVLPSESESFGVAALEAMSTGVPVTGYRVGGLPELVTGDVGRLVEPFDLDALADATLAILRNPSLRDELGRAARARALAAYRREPALDRYDSYFRALATDRTP